MSYFQSYLSLLAIHLMAVMTPGADFAIVVKNTFQGKRKGGFLTALGIACGVLIHISYIVLGLSFFLIRYPTSFKILKFLGAFYLAYVGFSALKNFFTKKNDEKKEHINQFYSKRKFFKAGFFTNIFNPQATFFFISIFSQFFKPQMPFSLKFLAAMSIIVVTFLWFASVAFLFSIPSFELKISRFQHYLEGIMGFIFILLSIKIILSFIV
ncbi:MAG: LysE family transporter [Bacteriovoracaceae bacterium]|nr:LysE family transporter [Bacteriovoracaceae bacterium]